MDWPMFLATFWTGWGCGVAGAIIAFTARSRRRVRAYWRGVSYDASLYNGVQESER